MSDWRTTGEAKTEQAEQNRQTEDDVHRHDAEFLGAVFRHRDEAKREADREFFSMPGMRVPPPDEGE